MDIAESLVRKVKDSNLLIALRKAVSSDVIPSGVFLLLKKPRLPDTQLTYAEKEVLKENMLDAAIDAGAALGTVKGLNIRTPVNARGGVLVEGTAEAILTALALDCVAGAVMGKKAVIGRPHAPFHRMFASPASPLLN
ncbi:MAG: hypothetical protein KGJ06_09250 [Pseudomonadota bacterium]|nr:hypothetical protein [Pseudomonadota bacterium]